jgi:hypothetical protein
MIKNINNTYVQTQVRLDSNEFIDCSFDRCTLEFSGTGPVSLLGCNFNEVNWVFSGPAQNTLAFLYGVYHGMGEGGRALVEATFENIRKPQK